MLARLALGLVVVAPSTLALAQGAPSSALCDGSEIRRAERLRDAGDAMFVGTAVADLVAMLTIPRNPDGFGTARSHFQFVAATSPVALVGLVLARSAHPREKFWERAIAHMKVGETRSADVRACLHRPVVATSRGNEERWSYVTARPSTFGGSLRTVRLVFRDSVLTDVQRTEVDRHAAAGARHGAQTTDADRHHGFCAPPIPAVADPFPTPIDTSAAAAAMARAQADADAAAKNAAAFAAYAACMASDSAR